MIKNEKRREDECNRANPNPAQINRFCMEEIQSAEDEQAADDAADVFARFDDWDGAAALERWKKIFDKKSEQNIQLREEDWFRDERETEEEPQIFRILENGEGAAEQNRPTANSGVNQFCFRKTVREFTKKDRADNYENGIGDVQVGEIGDADAPDEHRSQHRPADRKANHEEEFQQPGEKDPGSFMRGDV